MDVSRVRPEKRVTIGTGRHERGALDAVADNERLLDKLIRYLACGA